MSIPYINYTKALITSTSAKQWKQVSSQNKDTNVNSISMSMSESTCNEGTLYTQTTITCSSHLSLQISNTKNASWYTSSTLLPQTVDSLPKSSIPLLSLQMLVDSRQNQIKSNLERKDFFEPIISSDASNVCQKICQENLTYCNMKNIDKSDEADILQSHLSNTEFHLIDSNLSITSANYLSSTKNKNDNSYIYEKNLSSKAVTKNPNIIKTEINSNNHDRLLDNLKCPQSGLFFSPAITIEKVEDRNESEIIKDNCSSIIQTKNVIPTAITLISKLDKNVKDDLQVYYDTKRKINEGNIKSTKNFLKKGKQGVDSLLEKLESCTKRFHNDNLGSIYATNADEKEINSIRSISPEYCKSKSPNNRDDDVISPTFSNDDSNDTKQRRKRKLGKPIRLSKELKLEAECIETENVKPEIKIKSEISNYTNEILLPANSMKPCTESNTIRIELEVEKRNNVNIYSTENSKLEKEIKINIVNEEVFKNKDNNNKINHDFQNNLLEKKNFKSNLEQYLIHALKDTRYGRMRRNSESRVGSSNINRKKRRKSCGDVRNLLQESITVTTTNNISAFNEVESQLEKMFAGIIEADEDLLQKTSLYAEKSVSLLSDEEQKENCNCKLMAPKVISKNISSEVTTNNNYKHNKRNISKIRSHKKKINANKNNTDCSISSFNKNKFKQYNDKQHIKKVDILKNKKKNVKINALREIICDSSINPIPTKYRGPIIQIKGSKNSSLHIQIVNIPREDDEDRNKERRKTIGNGNMGRSKRLHFQNNLDYRGKVCNTGLFNSTLSIRYDAHTADVTWICVFCQRGPHFIIPGDSSRPHPNITGPHIIPGTYTAPAGVLSDLFGPYIIGKNIEDNTMSADEYEITKEQKQGNKNKRSLRYAGLTDQFLAKVCKTKTKYLNNSIFMGMSKLSSEDQQWEVWVHEECIVWATGVYITGGRISGLQDAVWDACQSVCVSCGLSGANIGCIKRGCKLVIHYCCALTSGWELNINQFIPKCNIHRKI